TEHARERIILENGVYKINQTDISFTEEQIYQEINQNPEKFSPNVILRPVCQEKLLPNIAFIGGGAEVAYWLDQKALFE
ncbi:bacillithiol biosynthesis protein BshC, partial [Streptococcus pneumoniae]